MPIPTTTYDWATTDVEEAVILGGNNILVENKVEPTESYLNSGILARQPWPQPYINYVLNAHGEWIDYLRRGEIGDVMWMETTVTAGDMATRFGGTWDDLGTTDFTMAPSGTETLRLFKRSA